VWLRTAGRVDHRLAGARVDQVDQHAHRRLRGEELTLDPARGRRGEHLVGVADRVAARVVEVERAQLAIDLVQRRRVEPDLRLGGEHVGDQRLQPCQLGPVERQQRARLGRRDVAAADRQRPAEHAAQQLVEQRRVAGRPDQAAGEEVAQAGEHRPGLWDMRRRTCLAGHALSVIRDAAA
jgi:hypothetical protein